MASAEQLDLRDAAKAHMYATTADDGTTVKPARSGFFDLPAELRLEIYEYAFADNMKTCQRRLEARASEHADQLTASGLGLGESFLPFENPTGPLRPFLPLRHPLLRANKNIYGEALPLHLECLSTYLEALKTAERENIELSGLDYNKAVIFGYEELDTQRDCMEIMAWLREPYDREWRPLLENCLWWTLRDEIDRVSSELDCWYKRVEWVDTGNAQDYWREDEIRRTGLRLYPVAQGVYDWKLKTGPRQHPKH